MSKASELPPIAVAERLASQIAASIDSSPVELIRTGMNHVFRSPTTVIRVSPLSTNAQSQVDRARRLIEAGIRVAAPLTDPIANETAVVTVWERIRTTDEPINYRDLGKAVAKVHRLDRDWFTRGQPLPLFSEAPWLQITENLDAARHGGALTPSDVAVLDEACSGVRGWHDVTTRTDLVICHGDIHPQNVLMSDGEVVIIDWDTVCIGPPEWDHAALMTWSSRWGGDPKTYEDFAQGYGADLRPSDAAQLLMRLRLLAPTINLAGRAAREPRFAAELKRRLEYWHGITNPATWTAQ